MRVETMGKILIAIGVIILLYTVEFGLGTPVYPIHLDTDLNITQTQLASGPTCQRPVFKLKPG